MKRIINGQTYNTETATKLALSQHAPHEIDEFNLWRYEILYVTRGGAFFLSLADNIGREEHLRPLTRGEAHAWVLSGVVELYTDMFGEPPEAEAEDAGKPEATIYIRVPEPLKRRIGAGAAMAGQSVNAWAMRCLEQCASAAAGTVTITEPVFVPEDQNG